jgi:hypothetical protein
MVVPFLNPHLRTSDDKRHGGRFRRTREEKEEILYGALAKALTLSSRERREAKASKELTPTPLSRQRTRKIPAIRERSRTSRSGLVRSDTGLSTLSEVDEEVEVHLSAEISEAKDRRSQTTVARVRTAQALPSRPTLHALVERVGDAQALASASASLGFYSVPQVKFLVRALWHVAFLWLYYYVLTHLLTGEQLGDVLPDTPPLNTPEKLFLVWALSLAYEHRQRHNRMHAFGLTAKLPFQSMVQVAHAILALGLMLRLLSCMPVPASWGLPTTVKVACYTAYQTIISVNAVLMALELFTFMWTSLSFGVLAIIIGQMLVDLSLFFVFFAVVLLGFSGALLGLSETADLPPDAARALSDALPPIGETAATDTLGGGFEHSGRALRGAHADDGGPELPLLALPLWAMFTDLEPGRFIEIPYALPLMYAYVMLANVVLVNLLIAMFSDTYSRIKKNAEVEYHYQRFLPIFEFNHVVYALPPPLNLPWLLRDLFADLLSICTRNAHLTLSDVEELHRMAAERPWNERYSSATSKKFVQQFLQSEADGTTGAPSAVLKKVEGLIQSLDERVGQQLERLDAAVGPDGLAFHEDVRSALNAISARLDHRPPGASRAMTKSSNISWFSSTKSAAPPGTPTATLASIADHHGRPAAAPPTSTAGNVSA